MLVAAGIAAHRICALTTDGSAGNMELSFDASSLTETSMLRVHELQEGYQSLISKANFSKSSKSRSW